MAEYDNEYESWEQHRDFEWDTELEGKYHDRHAGFTRVAALMERVPEGSLVLEMGCNSGGLSKILMSRRFCFCHGVDVAPHMTKRAREKGILAKTLPAEKTEYPDNKFDVVVASELLEHVFDTKAIVNEAFRVLKEGGKFVGSVPHERSYTNKKRGGVVNHNYHCVVFNEKSLRDLLSETFHSVETEAVTLLDRELIASEITPAAMVHVRRRIPQWYVFSGVK